MSEVKPCIHGRNFCLECHAALTEQEIKAKLYAALSREASLIDELNRAKSRYDREVLGLNNEGDPIGGDPAGGYKNDLARTNAAFDELASCVGFSEARLEQTGDSPVDCANQLQQRLTVAEQRIGDLELSAMWVRSQLTDAVVIRHIDVMLKPDDLVNHEIPGTSGMRLNMLANQGE